MSDLATLAQRAVRCKGWRWLPGMRVRFASGDTDTLDEGLCGDYGTPDTWEERYPRWCPGLPDLTDPCTLGGLQSLVREAWGIPDLFAYRVSVHRGETLWVVAQIDPHGDCGELTDRQWAPSEAAAWVDAMEAAP